MNHKVKNAQKCIKMLEKCVKNRDTRNFTEIPKLNQTLLNV